MKNNEFQELVDQNLSGLVWDERKRQRVLHALSEEEKPVKKFSATFILIAAILCISVAALAAGLVFSKRVDAVQLADSALEQKYGITPAMQTYFTREVVGEGNNATVTYKGMNEFAYVLGDYTVAIKDGKAETAWSRDGEDTAGGFDADAWGTEQLTEMMRINKETFGLEPFRSKAIAIAASHGIEETAGSKLSEEEKEALRSLQQKESEAAEKAAKLSIPEMEKIGREAVAVRYSFNQDQIDHLACLEENGWYLLLGEEKIPCYEFWFYLGYDEDGYEGEEGKGIYYVAVNVETGVVEDLEYEADLSGNG